MSQYMNHYYKDAEDDDMSLAEMISLKISKEEKNNYDWSTTIQQQYHHHQQLLQSSYYQLQYLQQQQMMTMMNYNSSNSSISSCTNSTISNNRPHYYHNQLSPSSSTSSIKQQKPPSARRTSTNTPSITNITTNTTTNTTTKATIVEPLNRRQSFGKRIKKVFGMTESTAAAVELPNVCVDTTVSTKINKKKVSSPVIMPIIPDSPNSSISSFKKHRRRRSPFLFQHHDGLPSPALSTVSTASSTTTSTSKKSLSFNSVIKLHQTFSASEYDRRCDTSATCQKLTPVLALKIKQELNHFKLNDMFVHVDSRQNTHFFI